MSQMFMRGLVGDSSITSFVFPGIIASRSALPVILYSTDANQEQA